MHRTIGYISKRFIQIRPGEGTKVLLTFLFFFLVITAYYVIKPVSRSLVLGDLGSRLVPYIDLISAILMGPLVTFFARLVDRVEKHKLVTRTFWILSLSLVVFWQCLHWSNRWTSGIFYLWVSIFSVLAVTLFWLVANDLYHPREAKRLFGFIGSGGMLGGIAGSSIAASCARLIGTKQLLLLGAGILVVCWFVVKRLWRCAPALVESENLSKKDHESFLAKIASVVKMLTKSRYLLLLVGLVGIAKVVATLIYYQFNPFIEQMFPDVDAKTAFMGLFLGWVNVIAFIVQFFFTSWILRRLGLSISLLILPAGLLCGSLGLMLIPVFWVAAITELYDGSMNYSLQQTSKELLYLPIDRSVRYKIKPFIDMVVFRFGKGIAAIIGIIALSMFHLEARMLSFMTVPLILAWIFMAFKIRQEYVGEVRNMLQAKATSNRTRLNDALKAERLKTEPREPEGLAGWLGLLSIGRESKQKLTLAGKLFASNGTIIDEAKQLLDELTEYELWPEDGSKWARASYEQLKEILSDPHENMLNRRMSIKQIIQLGGQDAVDCLIGMLIVQEDASIRQELIRGLTKLRLKHPSGLEFPKDLIRRQIAKEVESCQRITRISAVYRKTGFCDPARNYPDGYSTNVESDPAIGLLRLLLEERIQLIFRLLSLIYRAEDIYLIYNQLKEPDSYVRSDAIELLDNLIDRRLRRLIFPVLDEDGFLEKIKGQSDEYVPHGKEAYVYIQEAIWDHNQWLSITIVGLVGRMRLQPLFGELERASQSPSRLLSLAARAARRFAEESHIQS